MMLLPVSVTVCSAHAQETLAAAPARTYSIVPSVALTETLTDNVGLSPDKRTDSITSIGAGFHAVSNGGRLKGFFDYSLTSNTYARTSDRSNLQNSLNAAGVGELIPSRLFVDMGAGISQQSISAFGTQSTDSRSNSNRTEVRTLSVAPRLQGQLGTVINYQLRFSGSTSKTNTSSASDITSYSSSLHLDTGGGGSRFTGSADLSRQTTEYSLNRSTEADVGRGMLDFAVNPDLVVSAIGGAESNNYVSLEKRSHSIVGAQIRWIPSTRTRALARYERRFFGNSHAIDLSYRTAHTAWTYSDTRDVSTGQQNVGFLNLGSAHDVFSLANLKDHPEENDREEAVRQQLEKAGIDPNAQVIARFLTSSTTLLQSRALAFTLLGLRDSLTLRYSSGNSRLLDSASVFSANDLSTTDVIKQKGITVDLSHRLAPLSSLNFSGSWQQTSGSQSSQTSTLRSFTASYTTRLAPRIDASALARHSSYSSTTVPYTENLVGATLRLQF